MGVRTDTPKKAIFGGQRSGPAKIENFVHPKIGLCRLPSQRLTLAIDSEAHFRPGRAFSALFTKLDFWPREPLAKSSKSIAHFLIN